MVGSQVHQQRIHCQHPPHAERIGECGALQARPKKADFFLPWIKLIVDHFQIWESGLNRIVILYTNS